MSMAYKNKNSQGGGDDVAKTDNNVRNAYYRQYYQEHKEQRKEYNRRYWQKRAERMALEAKESEKTRTETEEAKGVTDDVITE